MSKLGELAYEAYGNRRGWVTYSGHPMPGYDNQDPGLQAAWDAAAMAVVDHLLDEQHDEQSPPSVQ